MKPTVITATVRPNEGELLQVCVEVPGTAYPDVLVDVLDEACVKVRRLMHDLTADQIKLYAERDVTLTGEADA